MNKFHSKYITFLHVWVWGLKSKADFKRAIEDGRCQVCFVLEEDLKKLKPYTGSYGVWTTTPSMTTKYEKKKLKTYLGYPRFNFGAAYSLDNLYLMDDIIAYCHRQKEYEQIRTAEDIRSESVSA